MLDPFTFCSAAIAALFEVNNLPAVVETYLCGEVSDLIVYLDLDEAAALKRIQGRSSSDNIVMSTYDEPSLTRFRAGLESVAPMFTKVQYPARCGWDGCVGRT